MRKFHRDSSFLRLISEKYFTASFPKYYFSILDSNDHMGKPLQFLKQKKKKINGTRVKIRKITKKNKKKKRQIYIGNDSRGVISVY